MRDWNCIVTVHEGSFAKAFQILKPLGLVQRTEFYNLLVMRADDPLSALGKLHETREDITPASDCIARFMPLERQFGFQSVTEFELKAQEAVTGWLPRLAHASFHVRMHRRGFKGKLSSAAEERFLDTFLLGRLEEQQVPAKITFQDPDIIIALETLGPRAGVSIWGRDELRRFPLLHLD